MSIIVQIKSLDSRMADTVVISATVDELKSLVNRAEAAEALAAQLQAERDTLVKLLGELLSYANIYHVHHLGEGVRDHCRYCDRYAYAPNLIEHKDDCPVKLAQEFLP